LGSIDPDFSSRSVTVNNMSRPKWRIALWVLLVLVAVLFLYSVRSILLPFILGGVISALLEPLIRKLRRRGWPKMVAVFTPVILLLVLVAGLGVWLAPMVSQQVIGFKDRIDVLTGSLAHPDDSSNFFIRWKPSLQLAQQKAPDPVDRFLEANHTILGRLNIPASKRALYLQYIEPKRPQISQSIENFLQSFLGIASGLVSNLLVLGFVPLIVILMLTGLEGIKLRAASWIPPAIRANTLTVLSEIGDVFISYLRGVAIAITGYILFIGIILTLFGAPYSLLLGVLFGALYLIPYLGGAISGTVLVIVTLLSGRSSCAMFHMSSPLAFAIVLLAIFLTVHMIYDAVIYPRIVGRAVGLEPIVSMFVIFSGGALFGLIGMIIAFPLAGAVKVVLDRLLRVTSFGNEGLDLPSIPARHRL
jgi:predicted PurR-regulated permease PerM